MNKVDWSKFLAREFLVSLLLIAGAFYEMHRVLNENNFSTVFPIWAGACLGFLATWVTGLTIQKVKALKAAVVEKTNPEQ